MEAKIYKNQTRLILYATVNLDITGATERLIKYIKPDGTTGSFDAAEHDAANGVIKYVVSSASDIDQSGEWTFWGYVTFADGKKAPGFAHTEIVYEEGK